MRSPILRTCVSMFENTIRLTIRPETASDFAEIAELLTAAFDDPRVAAMVAEIRASRDYVPELTFAADDAGELAGYAMLSYVDVEGLDVRILQLTPVAVRPDRQRRGIGTALVQTALDAAAERAEPLVLVEGVPAYYPRFGFEPASALGLLRPNPAIPEAAWMAKRLRTYDDRIRGRVIYPPWFPAP